MSGQSGRIPAQSDVARLDACRTHAEQQLEVCKIANEIMAMPDPKHRLDRLVALRGDKWLVNVHHSI